MKKLLAIAVTVALVASMFTGCKSSGAKEETDQTNGESKVTSEVQKDDSKAKTTHLKWAMWDQNQVTYYETLLDSFKKIEPDIEIELVDLGSTDYQTVLATQLSGGADDLDLISIKDIPGYANLVNLGMLEPLDDILTTDKSQYSGILDQITMNGKFYGVPFLSHFWIVYYNKDLFDQAKVEYPTNDMTLEQYDQIARKMTSGTGPEKVYGAHYHVWRSAVQLFGVLDGKHSVIDGSYDFLKPYYEMILKEQKDGIVMDYATLKTSQTHYSGVFFNNQIAMMNMGSWFIGTQIQKVKSGESLSKNWGIVKYPHPEGVEAGTTLGTITALGINSKSSKKEAAAKFLNFVCGPEGAKILAESGNIPAIKTDDVLNTIASVDGFPTDANSKEALNTVKTYLEMPIHKKSADIDTVLNEGHDNIMTENISIDEGIKEMNEKVKEFLK